MKKLIILLILLSNCVSVFSAVLPSDKSRLQTLSATDFNQVLQERDGDLLPIAPISTSRNYITASCNLGTPTYNWNYVYAKKFYRNGVELTGSGGGGSGDVIGPATNTDLYIPQWSGANTKTLKNGLPSTTFGQGILNAANATTARSSIGIPYHDKISVSSAGALTIIGSLTNTQNANSDCVMMDGFNNSSGDSAQTSIYLSGNDGGYAGLMQFGSGFNQYDFMGIPPASKTVLVGASDGLIIGTSTAAPIYFSTNDSARAIITSAGNFGIGNISPQGKLGVSGDIRATGNIYATTAVYSAGNKVPNTRTITFGIDGGGSVPSTGNLAVSYIVPVTQTVTDWYIVADASGSAIMDITRSGTSIIGAGNKPTLSSAISNSAAVSSWTSTTLTAGDRLVFVLSSIATCKSVNVILKTKE